MKKYLNAALHKLTVLLEFIISFVLAAGIIILLVQLILSMPNVPDLNIYPNYEDLVETCFNLIIGVELIRMLYQHKPSTVFEVLLFAIARQVIMALGCSPWAAVCCWAWRRLLWSGGGSTIGTTSEVATAGGSLRASCAGATALPAAG